MSVVAQYQKLESSLPAEWADARFVFRTDEDGTAARAASILSAFTPGRSGREVRFTVPRVGGRGEHARRMLRLLDNEGISGRLELVTASETGPAAAKEDPRIAWGSAAEAWDAEVAALPEDWTDIYGQVELASSDFLDRGALLLAPVNPARYGGAVGFRFRVARRSGYGASPGMTRRCLERLDEEGIGARVEILRALSDTRPVVTQGPVWYVGGKAV